MENYCKSCGGETYFSAKDKGLVCKNCGNVFPIKYEYTFQKNDFDKHVELEKDELALSMKNVKCSSCGANVMMSKHQLQTRCLYCGAETTEQSAKKKLMYIDSVVPFRFSKAEALSKIKSTVKKRFYANKRIFKGVSEDDIVGVYVNTFVFDFNTRSHYEGVLSYTETKKDNEGKEYEETHHKLVSGTLDKFFQNITIESNSNLEQKELRSIMPYEYTSAVAFKQEFMKGYVLEYHDKMFNECVEAAQEIVKANIENSILFKYNCDRIVTLNLDVEYIDKKYNYCLVPVYFVNRVYKDRNYKVVMNGQTGKIGRLPKDKIRVFLTILLIALGIVGIALLIMFLS